jgi:hypothetical protein
VFCYRNNLVCRYNRQGGVVLIEENRIRWRATRDPRAARWLHLTVTFTVYPISERPSCHRPISALSPHLFHHCASATDAAVYGTGATLTNRIRKLSVSKATGWTAWVRFPSRTLHTQRLIQWERDDISPDVNRSKLEPIHSAVTVARLTRSSGKS